jgi:hypothetical protein
VLIMLMYLFLLFRRAAAVRGLNILAIVVRLSAG